MRCGRKVQRLRSSDDLEGLASVILNQKVEADSNMLWQITYLHIQLVGYLYASVTSISDANGL